MKTFFAYFFSIVLLLPTLVSCVKDASAVTEVAYSDYKITATAIFDGIDAINNNYDFEKSYTELEFTQESVDYYAELLGYSSGDFSLAQVEALAQKLGVVSQEGVQSLLNQYDLTASTQEVIASILAGTPIQDLSNFPEYLTKSQNEKELIQLVNEITLEGIEQGRGCTFWGGLGALLGVLIGGAVCGPVCIILGGVVGGVLGCDLGGGKGSDDDPGQDS